MARPKKDSDRPNRKLRAPDKTLESRENQLISLAVDLAAKQLSEGTASSQVITHYLKLGSTKERLEKEKLVAENKLLHAKTESLQSQKKIEDLYINAIAAMKSYSGQQEGDKDDNDED
jgi:hypothetical protein